MLTLDTDDRGVARLTLNRPEVHNAFNAELVAALTESFDRVAADGARVLVLAGAGKSFSAGADLHWMRAMGQASKQDNQADAERLAAMLRKLDRLPCPTIARVQGPAFGGGVGLIACCDLAVAGGRARFALSEVRLGLIPATIAPFVVARMGAGQARRWMLTAERFDADTACRLGLISEHVADSALDATVTALVEHLLAGAPGALADCKALLRRLPTLTGEAIDHATAEAIAARRVSDEGQEGLTAFLEKRRPAWHRPDPA